MYIWKPLYILYRTKYRIAIRAFFCDNIAQMNSHYQRTIIAVIGLAVFGGGFIAGVFTGYSNAPAIGKITSVTGKETAVETLVDFAPFWKTWNVLNEKFVSANGTTTDQERVYGAIQGLVASMGDPYTVFFPPEEAELFESDIRGQFQGVGMEIGVRDNMLTVVAPLKGTPAERAGIRSGDKIVQIDDLPSADMPVDEAVRHIRGERGTSVKFTIVREGEKDQLVITVMRDIIEIPTIDTEVKGGADSAYADGNTGTGDVFVIRLYNFSANSANLFRNSLREFIISDKHKLILDLRGNPGGYLESAVDMASWFLPAGKVIVREDFANGEPENAYRSKGYDIFNENLNMVILVDGGSASASEILAGALSEHKIATLVGAKTFGKGSVQELVQITDDTSLKVTIARWLTPNGISISKAGITPDVTVEVSKEDIEAKRDTQMAKALEILEKEN